MLSKFKQMFQKGQSGNPAGRLKKSEELQVLEKITQAGIAAMQVDDPLGELWQKIWLQAHGGSSMHQKFILEYAYGKPRQAIELTDNALHIQFTKATE